MNNKLVYTIIHTITAVIIIVLCYNFVRSSPTPPVDEVVTDTVTYHDTIPYYMPVPKDSIVLRYRAVSLPVNKYNNTHTDTIADKSMQRVESDSAEVVIPITQRIYEDSTYKAFVSGYEPKLDSIFVYQKTTVINHYIREHSKRWGLGVQLGYGINSNGLHPYIGVGVNYNIFRW